MFRGKHIDEVRTTLCALSGAFAGKEELDEGGKVLLPQSFFREISTKSVVYPLQFELTSPSGRKTHCGVLEFIADEGQAILPFWMMETLRVKPMAHVSFRTVVLPKARYVSIQPQQKAFIELADPKAVLEHELSHKFSTLTVGDMLTIHYLKRTFQIKVVELKSGEGKCNAASIIDTDLTVNFERPADMPPSPVRAAPGVGFPTVTPGSAYSKFDPPSADAAPSFGAQQGVSFQPVQYTPPSLVGPGGKPKDGATPPQPAAPSFVAFGGGGRSLRSDAAAAGAAAATAASTAGRTLGGPGRTLGGGTPAPAPPAPGASDSSPATAPEAPKPFAGQGRKLGA